MGNFLDATANGIDAANAWLEDAGIDLNALDGAGRDVELGADALRMLSKSAKSISEAAKIAEKIEMHHAIPKFLGGAADQTLVKLSKSLHSQFHKDLRQAMTDAGLALKKQKNGGIGTATTEIAEYFKDNPGAQDKALGVLKDTAKKFDKEHGTNLYQAIEGLIKNGQINKADK